MQRSGPWLVPFVLACGCQCLVPVDELHERPDAGRDAGRDAGADAGTDAGADAGADAGWDGGCAAARDCPEDPHFYLCSEDLPARQSCIDGKCLRECFSWGRACTSGPCLTCDDGARYCPECDAGASCALHIESSDCTNLAADWIARPLAGCTAELTAADGGASLGTWERLEANQLVARLPSLGGTCVGERFGPVMMIHCPACTLISRGCE